MKPFQIQFKYSGIYTVVPVFQRYLAKYGGGLAMSLVDYITGEPIATCTVNIPEVAHRINKDEVLIKDWSENEGMLAGLIQAGIVEDTGLTVPTGFVKAHVCKVLIPIQDDI